MQTTFILRLVNAQREVLAWTKLPVRAKGDGCFWAEHQFVAEPDRDGIATDLIIHWQDVNVHTTIPLREPVPVEAGKVIAYGFTEPLITLPSDPRPLPPVTVRSVEIAVAGAGRL